MLVINEFATSKQIVFVKLNTINSVNAIYNASPRFPICCKYDIKKLLTLAWCPLPNWWIVALGAPSWNPQHLFKTHFQQPPPSEGGHWQFF